MPRVSRVQSWFGGHEFYRVINVNSSGQFSCELPQFAHASLGYTTVTGKTKEEVERGVKKAAEDYDSAVATHRKVIIYHIKRSAYVYHGAGEHKRCVLNLKEVPFTEGAALDFCVGIYDEVANNYPNREPHYEYNLLESSLPYSVQPDDRNDCLTRYSRGEKIGDAIEWTQEREDFFCKVGLALEHILLGLDVLADQDKTLELADKGTFKLLTN